MHWQIGRITIRIDDDVLDWFRSEVHRTDGGNYQDLIHQVLREHAECGWEEV